MSKTIFQVSKQYGKRLDEFRSPLSREWETILFKAVDIMHNLDREKVVDGRAVVNALIPILGQGQYDEQAMKQAVEGVNKLLGAEDSGFVTSRLEEVLELLTTVQSALSGK